MNRKLSAEEWLAEEKAIKDAYRQRLRDPTAGIDYDTAAARLRAIGVPEWQITRELGRIRR
jgi:hypothetical protein